MANITGKTIGELALLSGVTNNTLIPVELSGVTYHIPYSSIVNFGKKVYRAHISQASAQPPVVTDLYENTLGFTPTFGVNGTGSYSIYGNFLSSNTFITINPSFGPNTVILKVFNWINGSEYRISSYLGNGSAVTSWSAYLEIIVYP